MSRFFGFIALFCALETSAHATYCPGDLDAPAVTAHMTYVTIDGRDFPVVGAIARRQFEGYLRSCGENEAADLFVHWRANRRLTNTSMGFGVLVVPVLAVAPVTAISAGSNRHRMVEALSAARPERVSLAGLDDELELLNL